MTPPPANVPSGPAKVPSGRRGLPLPVLPTRDDRFHQVLGRMGAWIAEADDTGRAIYTSPSVYSVTGYAAEEVTRSHVIRIHDDDMDGMRQFVRAVHETGQAEPFTFRMRHQRGHQLWIEVTAAGWYPSPEGGFHSVSYNRDVTRRVQMNAALQESEERYRVVALMSSDLIVEVAADGRVTYVSPSAPDVLGFTIAEFGEMGPFETIHPNDLSRVQETLVRAVDSEAPVHFDPFRCKHKNGAYVWLESTGMKVVRADGENRYLGVTRDINERMLEEERLREFAERMQRAQKLEGLGVMAGGIAHDFNNLLTPILGAASIGLTELEADSPVRIQLLKIQRAAQRAAALTNQMLSYAGKSPLLIEPLDLSKLVEEMGQLLEGTLSGGTALHLDLAPGLPPIEADSAQLTQIVVNLISNAAEANRAGIGQITIRTGEVVVDEVSPSAIFADDLKPGRHAFFEVADTGCGMDAETVARIFDPFFTTKFTGRGLGLAAVAGIVRGHRGAVEIDSEIGRGTVIRVLFPVTTRQLVPSIQHTSEADSLRVNGTALVVDDDQGVRDLIEEVLTRAGLDVITATDGPEAIELFRRHAAEISVVLLDRTMPSANGPEVVDALSTIDSRVRVVLVSGYSQERATEELVDRKLAGFLKKPFTPEDLVEIVRAVLET
jgi:two-component system cell cycle sensor histidine kinase/response regulator CckA